MAEQRNIARAKRFRAAIAKSKPACHICGAPILYDAHYLDPLSFVIDHVIPLAKGGEDALSNIRAAHRRQTSMQQQEAGTHRCPHRKALRLAGLSHAHYVPINVLIHNNGSVCTLVQTQGRVPPKVGHGNVGSSRVDLQACKLEYSIVSPK